MDHKSILEQAEHYARSFFGSHVNEKLIYHNLYHTEKVVEASLTIARHYRLNEQDMFVVTIAAWFHDIGYLTGGGLDHEQRGAAMAAAFLEGTGVDASTIEAIKGCILATKLPQSPVSLPEKIVCDADLFHLGTDEFATRNKLMRKEAEALQGREIGKGEWRKGTIRLLEAHRYHTEYCQSLLDEKKQANLMKLKMKINDADPVADPIAALLHEHEDAADDDDLALPVKGKKNDKGKKDPGRGIDTVFRITSNNNQRLSTQADSKAHIMIQVNAIIISVLLSLLLRKIEEHANLAIPTFMLLTVNLVTIIFSILATRPHIPPGTFTKADLDQRKVNLLFFGNFYKMSLEEYANGMLQMLDDRDFLYGNLIRDVYSQGIVLGRKYRWLRISYNVFMFGLIISVVSFIIAVLAYPSK